MSRLGKKPFLIPEKVKVEIKDGGLEISGPLGKLFQKLPSSIEPKIESKQITLIAKDESKSTNMLHGLIRGLLLNCFEGVTKGFKKDLEVQGLGYKANVEGQKLILNLGFSSPKAFPIPQGVKITVDKQTLVSISGIDKALVGEVAASIRSLRPPEPYKGTGVRYVGEKIIRKAGKSAAAAGGKK